MGAQPCPSAGGRACPLAEKVFWDVKDRSKALVIELADEQYARLVLQVDDPRATVALIESTLTARK
ncbi:hypothetical protein GTY85_22620 [Streptomyces sp. SID8377]|nr:hypothetical protein [Streptomyces sp. SID8377]